MGLTVPFHGPGGRTLKAGIYCSVGKYIEAVYHLARHSTNRRFPSSMSETAVTPCVHDFKQFKVK